MHTPTYSFLNDTYSNATVVFELIGRSVDDTASSVKL